MRQVNILETETTLSRLADEAGAGETIILTKAGKPVAKLMPLENESVERKPRRLGFLEGVYKVPDNFDTMFEEEIIAMFEGRE